MNWIKVSEKIPNHNEIVLLYGKLTGIIPGCYDQHKHQWNTGGKFNLTIELCSHWMLLPLNPEE